MRRALYGAYCRAFEHAPDRAMNRVAGVVSRAELPRPLVAAVVAAWARRDRIDLREFEDRPFESVHDFFVRRLRPGVRPIGDGVVSPCDGELVFESSLGEARELSLKGARMDVEEVFGPEVRRLGEGARVASIFLSPRDYHRVHAPEALRFSRLVHVPGRFFPQNRRALSHIPRVYERNERVVLHGEGARGPVLLCMVGACMVGGIVVGDRLVRSSRRYELAVEKGDELGYFAFGSTVVVAAPGPLSCARRAGDTLRLGETLWT